MEQTLSPTILIIGTGSLRNYGCEAIVQGTYRILKQAFPDCRITLASDNHEYDRAILPNDIEFIGYRKRFTPKRIIKGIFRRVFHIGNGSVVRMDTSVGKKYDIVLSSGGDNYCERPDHGIYNILEDLMCIGAKAARKGNHYVLWGASVGPFHDKEIESRVMNNLARTTRIFVREELSRKYLSQFSEIAGKLSLVADPAFLMEPLPYDIRKTEGKIYIGINMSELAVGHSLNTPDKEIASKQLFAEILDEILEEDDRIEFILIPHVNMDGPQDDMNYLRPVYKKSLYKERMHLINPGLGSRKTKGLIKQLDLLVAARMHCCVGGISVGTPTLFITYSNKGKGMSEYAYGHHSYEIACDKLFDNPSDFKSLLKLMIDKKSEINSYLLSQSTRFKADSMKAGQDLLMSVQ